MKTPEQVETMKRVLRAAMMSLKASGAPPEVIERSALGLASAEDTLNWVVELPSELGRLESEAEQMRKRKETEVIDTLRHEQHP